MRLSHWTSLKLGALCLSLAGVSCDPTAVAAPPEGPGSSQIIKVYEGEAGPETKGKTSAIVLSGFRRPDMLGPIYNREFQFATAAGLDNMRYYAQAVGDLSQKCPALGLEAAKYQVLPYILSGTADLVNRLMSGEASDSEMFQALWLAMLGMNQHWSCQYNPSSGLSHSQAQAQCDQAVSDTSSLAVLPSQDAALDITVFLGRYGCNSPQTKQLAANLIAFGREAHANMQFTASMPAANTQEGKAYRDMYQNCTRRAPDNEYDAWCGCFVRTVHGLSPSLSLLQEMAKNPFVDGRSMTPWVSANLPGGKAVYQCEKHLPRVGSFAESRRPRATACLIGGASANGRKQCTYRAAWGEFFLTSDSCEPEITSQRWGYREVNCKAGGKLAKPRTGPREWSQGGWTNVDYEEPVTNDFVPQFPKDARSKAPISIRFLKRQKQAGLLKSMSVTVPMEFDFGVIGIPQMDALAVDTKALLDEKALTLTCNYWTAKGATIRQIYWFEKTPALIKSGNFKSTLQPNPYTRALGTTDTCPARNR